MTPMTLHPLDWLVVAAYLAAVLFIGLVVVRRQAGAEGYFLAGRQLRWPFIGASMFASNISAEHFVGLAGSGFAIGMAIGGFEWMAVYCIVPLVVLFLPFYVRNRIYTVPEFLERRFSPGVRLLFSGLMVVLSVLTKVSISLWASSIVFSDLLGWPRFWVIWGVGLVTCLYTMKGGLRAVVYTDALQTAVLLLAAVVLTALGLQAVGGWSGLQAKLPADMFSMVRPATDPDVPWPGMFIGVFILGSFYWSMDQVLVQRAFAAKSLDEGRKGAIFCAFLKLATPFLLVLPGLVAKALHPDLAEADHAFPKLLETLMPTGLRGLTVAGIAAALMGHISATYNSVATLVTRDFYLRFRPEADAGPAGARGEDRRPRRLRARRPLGPGHRPVPLAVDLPPGGAGLPDDADGRRLLPRRPLAAHQRDRGVRLRRDGPRRLTRADRRRAGSTSCRSWRTRSSSPGCTAPSSPSCSAWRRWSWPASRPRRLPSPAWPRRLSPACGRSRRTPSRPAARACGTTACGSAWWWRSRPALWYAMR